MSEDAILVQTRFYCGQCGGIEFGGPKRETCLTCGNEDDIRVWHGPTLGQRIAMLRQSAGLTQAGLADLAGVSRQGLSLLERDKTNVKMDTLNKVLRALGYSVETRITKFTVRAAPGREDG